MKLNMQGILVMVKTLLVKDFRSHMSYTVRARVMRVQTEIWKIKILWRMMKRYPICMRNKIRRTELASIRNGDVGSQWEMIKKYRDHQRLIIIMAHMESYLVLKIYPTIYFSAYLNVHP